MIILDLFKTIYDVDVAKDRELDMLDHMIEINMDKIEELDRLDREKLLSGSRTKRRRTGN